MVERWNDMESKTRIQERNHTLAATTCSTCVLSASAPKRIINLPAKVRKSFRKDKNREKEWNDEHPGNCDRRESVGGYSSHSSRTPITIFIFFLQIHHHHLSHSCKQELPLPFLFILPVPRFLSCLRLDQRFNFFFPPLFIASVYLNFENPHKHKLTKLITYRR